MMIDNIDGAICRLCGQTSRLIKSHILPAFVFKWQKETSITGYLRSGLKPNQREQDGIKQHLLCINCEALFNQSETQFANALFHPLNRNPGEMVKYSDWMLKFCVSVSWRVLSYFSLTDNLQHLNQNQIDGTHLAMETWANYLLGKVPHPSRFEQHFLVLDKIDRASDYERMPANINRYFLRTSGMDVVSAGKGAFTYSKMGRFVLLGFIEMPNMRQWKGTKIHAKSGIIQPAEFTLPGSFMGYLFEKCENFAECYRQISDKQDEVVGRTMRENINGVKPSLSFEAMDCDVKLFGTRAFDIHKRVKENTE